MKIQRLILALSLFFTIAGVTGCDNDGGSSSPPPLTECGDCPCDYASVPMTSECWSGENLPPLFDAEFREVACEADGDTCVIRPGNADGFLIGVGRIGSCCVILPSILDATGELTSECGERMFAENLSAEEVAACECQVEQYAEELDKLVTVDGSPFNCL